MSNEYYSRSSPGREFELIQDGFDLVSERHAAAQDALAGFITGCIPSNGSDATNDIDFSAGFLFDGTRPYTVGAKTKRADATWAAGSAAGGMASGLTFSTNTNYHLFVLLNPTTGTSDFGFDTSVTGTNLLADSAVIAAGFTVVKRCSSLRTGGSAAWPGITAREMGIGLVEYLLKIPVFEFEKSWAGGADDTALTATLAAIPGGIQVEAFITGVFADITASATSALMITSLDQTGATPSGATGTWNATYRLWNNGGILATESMEHRIRTSTSRTFRYQANASTTDHRFAVATYGWKDTRL